MVPPAEQAHDSTQGPSAVYTTMRHEKVAAPTPLRASAIPLATTDPEALVDVDRRSMVATRRRIPHSLLTFLCCVAFLVLHSLHLAASGKTNVILMISDGYGPASETFGRSVRQALQNNTAPDAHYRTPLDEILVGSHRSRSWNSLITDSAAGATAFACARKSYNGAIGVNARGKPCGTLFEAAKEKGWLTGVVVTSRLTDATPASFISHVPTRAQEADIASQLVTGNGTAAHSRLLDLAIGGGGCYFLPSGHPLSCRPDERDLTKEARDNGWRTVDVRFAHARTQHSGALGLGQSHPGLDTLKQEPWDPVPPQEPLTSAKLPLLRLLAPYNTPFEIDRIHSPVPSNPSLAELSETALHLLHTSPENKKGFLMMIEGSQIDLCAHANDAACHAREILAYQDAIASVRKFVDAANRRGERTLLISTSDHETGGITLGRQLDPSAYPDYAYYPGYLLKARKSAAALSASLVAYYHSDPRPAPSALSDFVREKVLVQGAGFGPDTGGEPSDFEVQRVLECLGNDEAAGVLQDPPIDQADQCRKTLADIAARRAQIGFTTGGHTGVDIPVHADGPRLWTRALRGNIENTYVGRHIAELLRLDLAAVTRRLNHGSTP